MKPSIVSVLLVGLFVLPMAQAEVVFEPLVRLYPIGYDFPPHDAEKTKKNNNPADLSDSDSDTHSVSTNASDDNTSSPSEHYLHRSKMPTIGGEVGLRWTIHRHWALWSTLKLENPSVASDTESGMQLGRGNVAINTRFIITPDFLFGFYIAGEALFPYKSSGFFGIVKDAYDVKNSAQKIHGGLDFIVLPLLSKVPYPLQITLGGHYTWSDSNHTLNNTLIPYDLFGATVRIAGEHSRWLKPFVIGYYRNHDGKIVSQPDIQRNIGAGIGVELRLHKYLAITGQAARDYHSGTHYNLAAKIDVLGGQAPQDHSLQSYLKRDIPQNVAPITFLREFQHVQPHNAEVGDGTPARGRSSIKHDSRGSVRDSSLESVSSAGAGEHSSALSYGPPISTDSASTQNTKRDVQALLSQYFDSGTLPTSTESLLRGAQEALRNHSALTNDAERLEYIIGCVRSSAKLLGYKNNKSAHFKREQWMPLNKYVPYIRFSPEKADIEKSINSILRIRFQKYFGINISRLLSEFLNDSSNNGLGTLSKKFSQTKLSQAQAIALLKENPKTARMPDVVTLCISMEEACNAISPLFKEEVWRSQVDCRKGKLSVEHLMNTSDVETIRSDGSDSDFDSQEKSLVRPNNIRRISESALITQEKPSKSAKGRKYPFQTGDNNNVRGRSVSAADRLVIGSSSKRSSTVGPKGDSKKDEKPRHKRRSSSITGDTKNIGEAPAKKTKSSTGFSSALGNFNPFSSVKNQKPSVSSSASSSNALVVTQKAGGSKDIESIKKENKAAAQQVWNPENTALVLNQVPISTVPLPKPPITRGRSSREEVASVKTQDSVHKRSKSAYGVQEKRDPEKNKRSSSQDRAAMGKEQRSSGAHPRGRTGSDHRSSVGSGSTDGKKVATNPLGDGRERSSQKPSEPSKIASQSTHHEPKDDGDKPPKRSSSRHNSHRSQSRAAIGREQRGSSKHPLERQQSDYHRSSVGSKHKNLPVDQRPINPEKTSGSLSVAQQKKTDQTRTPEKEINFAELSNTPSALTPSASESKASEKPLVGSPASVLGKSPKDLQERPGKYLNALNTILKTLEVQNGDSFDKAREVLELIVKETFTYLDKTQKREYQKTYPRNSISAWMEHFSTKDFGVFSEDEKKILKEIAPFYEKHLDLTGEQTGQDPKGKGVSKPVPRQEEEQSSKSENDGRTEPLDSKVKDYYSSVLQEAKDILEKLSENDSISQVKKVQSKVRDILQDMVQETTPELSDKQKDKYDFFPKDRDGKPLIMNDKTTIFWMTQCEEGNTKLSLDLEEEVVVIRNLYEEFSKVEKPTMEATRELMQAQKKAREEAKQVAAEAKSIREKNTKAAVDAQEKYDRGRLPDRVEIKRGRKKGDQTPAPIGRTLVDVSDEESLSVTSPQSSSSKGNSKDTISWGAINRLQPVTHEPVMRWSFAKKELRKLELAVFSDQVEYFSDLVDRLTEAMVSNSDTFTAEQKTLFEQSVQAYRMHLLEEALEKLKPEMVSMSKRLFPDKSYHKRHTKTMARELRKKLANHKLPLLSEEKVTVEKIQVILSKIFPDNTDSVSVASVDILNSSPTAEKLYKGGSDYGAAGASSSRASLLRAFGLGSKEDNR